MCYWSLQQQQQVLVSILDSGVQLSEQLGDWLASGRL
jgi:hypothetical protein